MGPLIGKLTDVTMASPSASKVWYNPGRVHIDGDSGLDESPWHRSADAKHTASSSDTGIGARGDELPRHGTTVESPDWAHGVEIGAGERVGVEDVLTGGGATVDLSEHPKHDASDGAEAATLTTGGED